MASVTSVSGTTDPYAGLTYTAANTDKNTLSITSYIQLLAVQLQNQDLTDPMDSNDMMGQLTQMAMVQSLSSMTEALDNSVAMDTTTYAASLIGKGVTVAVTDSNNVYGTPIVVGSKYGVVESVNLSGDTLTFRLKGDTTDYPLAYLMGIGDITSESEEAAAEDSTEAEAVEGSSGGTEEESGVEAAVGETEVTETEEETGAAETEDETEGEAEIA